MEEVWKYVWDMFPHGGRRNPNGKSGHACTADRLAGPLSDADKVPCYISNFGRYKCGDSVKTIKARRSGYPAVRGPNGIMPCIHQLVADKFLDKSNIVDPVVSHKNHNKEDNRVENLEFVTRAENSRKGYGRPRSNKKRTPSQTAALVLRYHGRCGAREVIEELQRLLQ